MPCRRSLSNASNIVDHVTRFDTVVLISSLVGSSSPHTHTSCHNSKHIVDFPPNVQIHPHTTVASLSSLRSVFRHDEVSDIAVYHLTPRERVECALSVLSFLTKLKTTNSTIHSNFCEFHEVRNMSAFRIICVISRIRISICCFVESWCSVRCSWLTWLHLFCCSYPPWCRVLCCLQAVVI